MRARLQILLVSDFLFFFALHGERRPTRQLYLAPRAVPASPPSGRRQGAAGGRGTEEEPPFN